MMRSNIDHNWIYGVPSKKSRHQFSFVDVRLFASFIRTYQNLFYVLEITKRKYVQLRYGISVKYYNSCILEPFADRLPASQMKIG